MKAGPRSSVSPPRAMIAAAAADESSVERTTSAGLGSGVIILLAQGVASTVSHPVEGETEAFANVKVFERGDNGRWSCVLWQVSPRPLP